MRRPSLIVGTAVLVSVLSALLVPTAAHAVDADQSLVVSGTPAGWTPQVLDGEVDAIAAVGADIVIGGTFTQVQDAGGGTTYARTNIAAFDAATGLVDPDFAPTLDGSVAALDSFGGNVVVGGSFATVDGVKQRGITELTLAGARVTAFAADLTATNKVVNTLVVRAGRLFIGGKFEKVNNVSRGSLAVLNPATGVLDAFNLPVAGTLTVGAPPSVSALDVSADGSTLVVGGNFTTVGGLPRTQLAIIDATAGKVTTWQTTRLTASCSEPGINTYVRELSIVPDGSYFVMVNGGGPQQGTLCDSASRWELGRTGASQQPTWVDATGGDTLTSVATTGTAVYVGGHQRWVNNYFGDNSNGPGSVDRSMIAALDPVTGLPLSWDPGVGHTGTGLYDLLATPAGLWVGGDNLVDKPFAGHQRLAFFPVSGGTTVPAVQPQTLPRNLFTTTPTDSLLKRSYDGSVFGATSSVPSPGSVAWGSVTGAFMLSGSVYYGTSDGTLHKASFDGTTVGAPSTVGTFWSTSPQPLGTGHSLADVTSFTIGSGRVYYVTGDGKLYYRWFSNESDVVGSEEVTAAASGYTDAHEMFVANGNLYFAKADGKLYRIALSTVSGAPFGAATAVSGTGIDANTWNDKAAFLSSSAIKSFVRLYGADRVATSLAVSQDQFTAGSAGAVVLARSDAFPDGLAGAPLAYRTHAPVLLTAPTALDSRVSTEIQRVLPHGGTVYELGGTASISTSVENAVIALGYTPVRLGGIDRYGTSIAIAQKILTLSGGATKALVVTGQEFPDALGAGAAAAVGNGVVLLTNGASMPTSVATFLTAHPGLQVWGVGGKGAAAAKAYDPTLPAGRILIGADRTETATLLAQAFFPAPTDAVLVNSVNFPDGLSGGPFAAAKGGPILLTPQAPLAPKVVAYLTLHAATIAGGHVLGGPAMVSDPTMALAASSIS